MDISSHGTSGLLGVRPDWDDRWKSSEKGRGDSTKPKVPCPISGVAYRGRGVGRRGVKGWRGNSIRCERGLSNGCVNGERSSIVGSAIGRGVRIAEEGSGASKRGDRRLLSLARCSLLTRSTKHALPIA